MMSYDRFTINTIVPFAQTAAVAAVTYATGQFLNHSVTLQTAALISGVASIVAAVADKFIPKDTNFRYAANLITSSGVGIAAGALAHCFIYPTLAINAQAAGAFFLALIAVRGVHDFLRRERTTVTAPVTP